MLDVSLILTGTVIILLFKHASLFILGHRCSIAHLNEPVFGFTHNMPLHWRNSIVDP